MLVINYDINVACQNEYFKNGIKKMLISEKLLIQDKAFITV